MKIEITKIPTTTYKYSFSFKDEKGFVVTVENFNTLESCKKHIDKTMRRIKKKDYKIIENYSL